MLKSPFGRGVTTTVALLVGSLTFYPLQSVGETITQGPQKLEAQQESDARANAPDETETEQPVGPITPETTLSTPTEDSTDFNKPVLSTLTNKTAETMNERIAQPQHFTATAYSLRGRTASGKRVSRGVIAADHKVLPLGTRVRLDSGSYSGEYVVADTGGSVRGRKIDIWVPHNREAFRFGRRTVKLTVLNYETKAKPRAEVRR